MGLDGRRYGFGGKLRFRSDRGSRLRDGCCCYHAQPGVEEDIAYCVGLGGWKREIVRRADEGVYEVRSDETAMEYVCTLADKSRR